MDRGTRIASIDSLAGPGPHAVSAGGVDLVVVRTSAGLRAFQGRCPHQGALLGEGELDGGELVCRNHRWRFDAQTGKRLGGDGCLEAVPLLEDGGVLYGDLSKLRAAEEQAKALRQIDELPGPRGLPLLGNTLQVEPDRLHRQLEDWAKEHGTPFKLRIGSSRVLVVADSALNEQVLRARPETFRRLKSMNDAIDELGGRHGLFTSEGAEWRGRRKLAMEALSHRRIHGFFPILKTMAERLVRRWRAAAGSGAVVDVQSDLKRFTVDVTTQLAFGHDVNTIERDDDAMQRRLELVFPTVNRRIGAAIPYWRVFRLPADRRVDRAIAELREWIGELLARTRQQLAADPARAASPANFLEAMAAARDDDGRPYGDDVIFGNAMQMLLAGEDTTAHTLAWSVHLLLEHPAAVAALRSELDGQVPGELPVDLDGVQKLHVAGAVANETMRLKPVAPLHFYEPNEDAVVGDIAVPKGAWVILLTRPPAMNGERFAEPQAFRPERWLDGGAVSGDARSHIPFGTGPRICPGRSLALVEMRLVLAALYKSFDVTRVGEASQVRERYAFTMQPDGVRVKLTPRAR